ncbi:MAG: iron-containing alcohol dehydrogenase, partial [Hyphomicrobiaceae bacterium]
VVFEDAGNIESRTHMMSAAMMGATAFQKCLGAIHALSHPVGSIHGTHHGLTNAVFMPYVLAFNRPQIEEKVGRLSSYLGLPATFSGFMEWVLELRSMLAIPHTLEELIRDDSRFAEMSEMAPRDPTAGGNPIPINSETCLELYRRAWSGNI